MIMGEIDEADRLFSYAVWLHQSGDLASAERIYQQIVIKNSLHAEAIHLMGVIAAQKGQTQDAINLITRSIDIDSNNSNAFKNRGLAWHQEGVLENAAKDFLRAASIDPANLEAKHRYGSALLEMHQYEGAATCFEELIRLGNSNPTIYNDYGNALQALHEDDAAVAKYKKAIELDPGYADAYYNLGILYQTSKQFREAISQYDEAIRIDPGNCEAHNNRGLSLEGCGQPEDALFSYDLAITINSQYAEAYVNRGNALLDLRQFDLAITSYNQAIYLKPKQAEFYIARAGALCEMGRHYEALKDYDSAIGLNPQLIDAYVDRATALTHLRQYRTAAIDYKKALTLNAKFPYLIGMKLHADLMMCDWDKYHESRFELNGKAQDSRQVVTPFHSLTIIDSPELQQKISKDYVEDKFPRLELIHDLKEVSQQGGRIRVGYFSGDFRSHPVANLLIGVLESHNKKQFETFAFSFRPPTNDDICKRLTSCFDHFHDVEGLSDQAIVKMARDMQLDIAIDLSGFTQHSRTGLFAQRVAPIQVNYLGYAGTMGANFMDYILADETVIPRENMKFFDEKIAYLPNSFMPSDSSRVISRKVFTREELNLPKDSFVFCCFNNSYKISPDIFASWMNILKAVDNSVLWFSKNNEDARENLLKEARKYNIAPERLIFATVIDRMDEHLARYRCADLFLDTSPYNAHATANDALWAGLPVITYLGKTFQSRVAASLLSALDMPELVAENMVEYQNLAVELAIHPSSLLSIRAKLGRNRLTHPLFDTPLFVRHIEAAYLAMYERCCSGLTTEHLYIGSNAKIGRLEI